MMHMLTSQSANLKEIKGVICGSLYPAILDSLLFTAYCLFVFAFMPIVVLLAWGIEAIQANAERNKLDAIAMGLS